MSQPNLSIIVVNWNTRDMLRDCLASLPAACGKLHVETLVVDNDSHDGSAEMVRSEFPTCELIESGGNLGFSRGNNLALGRAGGDRLLLLNPDTVCPPDSLARLANELDTLPGAMAVGPALVDEDDLPTASFGDFPSLVSHFLSVVDPVAVWLARPWRDRGLGRIPRIGGPPREVDYVKGACLMMTREAFETIGSLDERYFMYFEETDWCRRAHAAGGRVYLCPKIRVAHLEGRASEQVSDFSLRQFHHSYRLYVRKHHGEGRSLLYRFIMWMEYGVKGLARRLSPGDDETGKKNRAMASQYFATARLQFETDIAPLPPSGGASSP